MSDEKNLIPTMGDDKQKGEETVEVPKSLLESLEAKVKLLEKDSKKTKVLLGDDVVDDEADKQRDVRLRMYDGKIVIHYNKEIGKDGVWKKYDEVRREDRMMMEITLLNEDGTETKRKVDYLRFFEESAEITVPVLKTEKKKVVEEKGLIRIKTVIDYKTVMTKNKMMQKVTSSNDIDTVLLPNGEKREINVNDLNA